MAKFEHTLYKSADTTDDTLIIWRRRGMRIALPSIPYEDVPSLDHLKENTRVFQSTTELRLDNPTQPENGCTLSFVMEQDRSTVDGKILAWRLYLKMKLLPEGSVKYFLFPAIVLICSCKARVETFVQNLNHSNGVFDMDASSHINILSHDHDSSVTCQPSEINLELMEWDVSKATELPIQIVAVNGRRDCFKGLKPVLISCLSEPDILITCRDGKQLEAHKGILMARSKVFETMLSIKSGSAESDTSFVEAQTRKIQLEDIDYMAMKVILRFIYTGTLVDDWKLDAEGVANGANKYDLQEILRLLDHLLPLATTHENALQHLNLAELHSVKSAEKSIQAFIQKDLEEVLLSQFQCAFITRSKPSY